MRERKKEREKEEKKEFKKEKEWNIKERKKEKKKKKERKKEKRKKKEWKIKERKKKRAVCCPHERTSKGPLALVVWQWPPTLKKLGKLLRDLMPSAQLRWVVGGSGIYGTTPPLSITITNIKPNNQTVKQFPCCLAYICNHQHFFKFSFSFFNN